MFDNATDVKTYTLAGHATLTLTSQRTGTRYTYRINRAKDNNDLWFVGLLAGPDNETDYNYMGIINGQFRTTAKSRYKDDAIPVKAFNWFWKHIDANHMPPKVEIRHSGHCGRCGRKLTVPESVDAGIGPICRGLMGLPPLPHTSPNPHGE